MSVAKFFNPKLRARLVANEIPGWLQRHSRKRYIISVILSTPPWVDQAAVRALREEVKRQTRVTGIKHVLDHIIPVTHPYVCGLSVPCNLRVIPHGPNAFKSNKFHPDQMELEL